MVLGSEQIFWLLAIAIGGAAVTLWAFVEHLDVRVKARAKLRQTEAREETRREIAAYVAEGSISPDDAAKLMAAGVEGFEGIKMGLRDVFAKGAEACRGAGEKARAAGVRVHVCRPEGGGAREKCCESV